MTFRLKSWTALVTAYPALYRLRHEVNTLRTAAWDVGTVASCTDKWQPEPHYPHFSFSYTHFTSLGSLWFFGFTHTLMTLWCTDRRSVSRKPVWRTHATTHSRMRDFCQLRLIDCSLSYCKLLGYDGVTWLWRCSLVNPYRTNVENMVSS